MNLAAKFKIGGQVSIDAVVINGRTGAREDLGRIAFGSPSVFKRFGYKWRRSMGGLYAVAPMTLAFAPHPDFAKEAAALGLITLGYGLLATFIVDGGEAIATNLISGLGGTVPKFIGWGIGAGTTARTDSSLFTEKDVDLSGAGPARTTGAVARTTVTDTNDNIQVTGTRTMTGAGPVAVLNAGLFDAASAGNLWLKGDFAAINLSLNDGIAFTFNSQATN